MKTSIARGIARFGSLLLVAMMPALASAVTLSGATAPSTGVSGITNVNVTGSGYPAGTILPAAINIHLAATCGGAPAANTTALSIVTILGTSRRVQFQIPAVLPTGTYFVSLDGATTTAVPFASSTVPSVGSAVTCTLSADAA